MGCYNATCFMSNTPILSGEKIAIFVLAPKHTDTTPGFAYVPESKYKPIGFPIIAEFDEDIGFRNISHVSVYAERYFKDAIHVYRKNRFADNENTFEEYQWAGVNEFVNGLIDGELFVKCEDDVLRRLSYVMMHEELRQSLLGNIASRIPYKETETYKDLMRRRIENAIEECRSHYEHWLNWSEDCKNRFPWHAEFSLYSRIEQYQMWDNLDTMVSYYIEAPDHDIVEEIVNYTIWRDVMGLSRKGYHCYPSGNQCEDMQCHKIIAEFVLAKYDERKESRRVEEILSF